MPEFVAKLISESPAKLLDLGVSIGTKLLGAIALWIFGRIVVAAIRKLMRAGLERRKVDATFIRYLDSSVAGLGTVILVILVLGLFGVQTTTFAGLLAAMALAIGTAWSGLLSNFAAGMFLVVLRPMKVGDHIAAGGVEGAVQEIGLFVTTLCTADNIRIFVGNNKLFSDNIVNFSANPYRRVDLSAQLAHSVNAQDAVKRLQAAVAAIPNVVQNPAPCVEIVTFTLAGPVLAVRPFCNDAHYWDVFFATNKAIYDVCSAAGYPVPEIHQAHRSVTK